MYIKMAKRNSKKQKKSSFYEENSLVGLTPGSRFTKLKTSKANFLRFS